ncbi:MAG: flagellar hook-basal body complex protein FliE [Hydrogenimonas sp.]|nr:MAG: flagellar hook-basal body complex protein FliE [Hydrogenimonas sp.]
MDKNIQGLSGLSTNELFQSKQRVTKPFEQDFSKVLKASLDEVNDLQKAGESALSDIATGQVKDLHQAALAINKAETSMKLMLEVRNKAINAYKEILRTQI